MDLDKYALALYVLQNSLYPSMRLNDAVIDVIEMGFTDTGKVEYCPPHTHTWFEFNYVASGLFYTSFGEEMQEIGEGRFFVIPPGMEHSHRYNSKKKHRDLFFRWQMKKTHDGEETFENSLFQQLEPMYRWEGGCSTDDGSIARLLEQMLEHGEHNASPILLQLDFINVLTALSCFGRQEKATAAIAAEGRKIPGDLAGRAIIKKVEVHLNDLKFHEFDVHSIAASLHMSYGHLSRLYKKYSGQTIIERLTSIRLEKSCMLLEQTSYSMKEISDKLGFSNQYYFSKVFKERYGVSPTEYRKNPGFLKV